MAALLAAETAMSVEGALWRLRRPKFFKTQRFQEQQWHAKRAGGYPPLLRWEHAFVQHMRARKVPIWCVTFVRSLAEQDVFYQQVPGEDFPSDSPHVAGFGCWMAHCFLDPTVREWEALWDCGLEVAKGHRLELAPPTHDNPYDWRVAGWQALGPADPGAEKIGRNRNNVLRQISPPGEVAMLKEYYGIRDDVYDGWRFDLDDPFVCEPREIDPVTGHIVGEPRPWSGRSKRK